MKEDIINKNSNGEYHGYQEWYLRDKIYYRGIRKNDNRIGYTEWFRIGLTERYDGKETNFYIR